MRCPCCGKELILDIKREYETEAEHIMCSEHNPLRDSYICKSENCFMNGIGFWGFDGSFYLTKSINFSEVDSHVKNGLTAALGSFERKIEAESAWRCPSPSTKNFHDMKDDVILHIGKHMWVKNWDVEANEEGDIIKKKYHITHLYNGFKIMSNFHMLSYCINQFFKCKKWKDKEHILKEAKEHTANYYVFNNGGPWYHIDWYRYINYWFIYTYFKILKLT